METIAVALKQTLAIYHWWGLNVSLIKGDPEFIPLEMEFDTKFIFCAQNEHVPEIERYVRTVKERTRCGHSLLPFCWMPCLVIIWLVSNAIFWLNAFPHPDGI